MHTHLFPNRGFASETFVAVFLWFGRCHFYRPSVELASVHIIDRFLRIFR